MDAMTYTGSGSAGTERTTSAQPEPPGEAGDPARGAALYLVGRNAARLAAIAERE